MNSNGMNLTGANGENRGSDTPFSPFPPVKNHQLETLSAADLARMAGLSMVKAHEWLRQLPHVKIGRSRYTRPEWLAQWEAARLKNPPAVKSFDPLEAAVADRAAWAVSELVRQGKLQVCGWKVAGGGLSAAFSPTTYNPQPTTFNQSA